MRMGSLGLGNAVARVVEIYADGNDDNQFTPTSRPWRRGPFMHNALCRNLLAPIGMNRMRHGPYGVAVLMNIHSLTAYQLSVETTANGLSYLNSQ